VKAATNLAVIAAMFPELLTLIPEKEPAEGPVFTHVDEARIKKAEAKRARKAAKRAARAKKGPQ
jgi:hypothetical protein